jgi:hypothetical protein
VRVFYHTCKRAAELVDWIKDVGRLLVSELCRIELSSGSMCVSSVFVLSPMFIFSAGLLAYPSSSMARGPVLKLSSS